MWPSRKRLPVVAGRSPQLATLYYYPTRLGVGLGVLVALLWLMGLNYQANLAYAVAFWLAGFIVVALLHNLRQLLGLQIDVAMPQEVFAGEEAVLELSTPTFSRARHLWLCNEEHAISGENEHWQAWQINHAHSHFKWHLPAMHRGYLRVPPLRTASIAPFGISMVQCVWHWPSVAVVFPAPIPHAAPNHISDGLDGETTQYTQAGSDDIAYLQAHQIGSLQHIAWKQYAKTGVLLDKHFESPQTAAPETLISYRDYLTTDINRLAGLLCHRVLQAEARGENYALELPNHTIAPQQGQRVLCLTALALWGIE